MRYKRAFISEDFQIGYTNQDRAPVYLERWAACFNLVRTIPRDRRFDMSTFGTQANTECGTAACAAGHAQLHPWFRRRGLKPGIVKDDEHLNFRQPQFFGMNDWNGSPFDPDWVMNATELYYLRLLTPAVVSETIMCWMLIHWPKEAVAKAVEKTEHVVYDAEFVHRYTPWKGERLGYQR